MKTIAMWLVLALFGLCPKAAAEDLSANGYTFSSLTIEQVGETIKLSGRIADGETCQRLRVEFSLKNEKGKSVKVSCMVKDVEKSGSRLFEGVEEIKLKKHDQTKTFHWKIEHVDTKCQRK